MGCIKSKPQVNGQVDKRGANKKVSSTAQNVVAFQPLVTGVVDSHSLDVLGAVGARLPDKTVYVGIDFGTSRSGYAFAYGADSTPQLQFNWPGESVQQAKTLTAILYDKRTWEALAWGMDAYVQYMGMLPKEQANYLYLEGFKLLLSETAESTIATALPADCPHTPEVVIGHFLGFLQVHLQQQLRRSFGADIIESTDVKYCMTIPAGWSDSAKHKTRKAAALAGLVSEEEASSDGLLTLLYEPEAAALTTCQQSNLTVELGQKFLILDAGGGTVDFTMHVVEMRNGEKVLSEATYRACLLQGSKLVDQLFQQWLAYCIGSFEFSTWCNTHTSELMGLMTQWEQIKRGFEGKTRQGGTLLRLPYSLARCRPSGDGDIDDRILIPDADMCRMFDSSIKIMIETVRGLVERAGSPPDRLMLVGGFGSSLYLRNRLHEAFGTSMGQLLSPPFAYSAVVEGAVRHLQKPSTIAARVSALTYGIRMMMPWDPATMPDSIREQRGGEGWVTREGFLAAVTRGQKVEVSETFTHEVSPTSNTTTAVFIKIFSTPETSCTYLKPDMEEVACIEVPVDQRKRKGKDKYWIRLTFSFGAAEIIVEAHDLQQDTRIAALLDFNTSHQQRLAAGHGSAAEMAQKMAIRV